MLQAGTAFVAGLFLGLVFLSGRLISGAVVVPGASGADSETATGDSAADAGAMIQAFVVPHSHMDVGWIYTVEVFGEKSDSLRILVQAKQICSLCCTLHLTVKYSSL